MSDGPDLLDLLLSAVDDQGQPFTGQQIVPDIQVTLRTKYGLLAKISQRQKDVHV